MVLRRNANERNMFKKLFGLDALYDRTYGLEFLMIGVYASMAGVALFVFAVNTPTVRDVPMLPWLIFGGVALLALLYGAQEIVQYIVVSRRIASMDALEGQNEGTMPESQLFESVLYQELGGKMTTMMIQYTDTSQLYDVKLDVYTSTKYGDYKSRERYYTVFEYKLQRKMPHVVFDGVGAKRKQFGHIYVAAQKVALEGNFSKHFDVYMPEFYQVDTLSFVTPEVMQAMLALPNFDFEIKEDSLLCYAPLMGYEHIIAAKPHVETLYRVLNDNLDTYRDNRLTYRQGKERVTEFGSSLLVNPNKYVPYIIVSALAGIVVLITGILIHRVYMYIAISAMSFAQCYFFTRRYVDVKNKNNQRIAAFRASNTGR